jgi:PAS domain S-box-containing protein
VELSAKRPKVARLIRALLIASVVVPIAANLAVEIPLKFGIYGETTAEYLHVGLTTMILLMITFEIGRSIRRTVEIAEGSEERLRLQVERMPIACITTTNAYTFASWSPAAERIFGWTESEVVGRSAAMILPPHFNIDLQAVWNRLLAGDFQAHSINENVTKDGRTILCRWTNTPLIGADGKVQAVFSMAEDISDQSALRQTEERYRVLVNSLPHYIFSVDNEDRYIAINAAIVNFFNRPESEILGRTPAELGVPPNVAEEWLEMKMRTRRSGVIQTDDSTMAFGDTVRHFRTITAPVRDPRGEIVGVTGVSMDVTDQKNAEVALQKLMTAVEQLDEVMFTTDRDGVITYVNAAFEKVYGFTRDEAIGKTPRILKSGDIAPEMYAQMWRELLGGRSLRMEYRNRRKDGSLINVIGSASPVLDKDGNVTGFIAVQQDITEHRRATEERRQLDDRLSRMAKMEALGTLAGGIAHDFNNILAIVLTHATLIERRHGDPGKTAEAIATVRQAVQRGAALSKQILTFARRAEIRPEQVAIAQVVMELGSMILETFPRTIQVTFDLDPDVPSIRADSGQLHQALLNLCLNARDAMPGGGSLVIGAHMASENSLQRTFPDSGGRDYVCITVTDTGTGMDETTRRRIFEPFFTTKEKGKGTGLGLAMVYGIVNSHGGMIDVDSEIGRGTQFRLYFPLGRRESTEELRTKPAEIRGGSETILLMEDEPAILTALNTQLTAAGYQVFTAGDGEQGLRICRRVPNIGAVIMDLGMPKISAPDLVKGLHNVAPDVPVIAMTGYIDPDDHATVVADGVKKIVQKPFDIEELLSVLRDVLESRLAAATP